MLPLAIAAMVLGTGMQYAGQQRAQNAMTSAALAEIDRQNNYDREKQAVMDNATQGFEKVTGTDGQLDQKRKVIDTKFQNAIKTQVGSYLPGSGGNNAPSVIKDAFDKKSQAAEDKVRSQATAFANMQGLGNLLRDKNVDLARSGQDAAMLGTLSRASEAINPLEIRAASRKGSGMRLLGDLLSTGGGIALGPALSGASPAVSPATAYGQLGQSAAGRGFTNLSGVSPGMFS